MGYEYHDCISGVQGMAGAGVKICQKVILDASGSILLLRFSIYSALCVTNGAVACFQHGTPAESQQPVSS
jgi:hypothetical protein